MLIGITMITIHCKAALVDNLPVALVDCLPVMAYQNRIEILQGTLDMLILRTLQWGPQHGHGIGQAIRSQSDDLLQIEHGSLYPALHRLEHRGCVTSKWEMAPDRNREFKYYRLTDKGRKQLVVEESQWKQMAEAVARVMWPAAEES